MPSFCSRIRSKHVERAVDDVLHDVALVGDADVAHGVPGHHAVLADKPVGTSQHLVAARTVVRVEQDDFVGFFAGDFVGVPHAAHVPGEFAAVVVAYARLADHERLEAFVAQAAQHVDGGDVGVALGAAFVLAVREDGRGDAADLVVRQGGVGAEHRRAVTERGSELHGTLHNKRG